ncbi:HAD-IA family hydrolase [Streptomyces sp. R302]|uniref:HAD family hydrolase n=1 Tax=unclassified Streptomyces TaxID=2593676 RepID=UPI00145DEF70|nr:MULTISPECIES: HAD-IA family hydrolase [unclassified Streptomyces]NML51085.1 HAD-IA family hydrolase [Streptomyces sp. R301]NML81180.1 HAD-IA family hydrolase [Streptomyces sp. R302]
MSAPRRTGFEPPRAVVLDTDGVLIDSAAVHAAAWKTAFDGCLAAWTDGTRRQEPFDADADYRRYVDGRSRADGAEAFLTARGIRLPPGTADDRPGCGTMGAVAARKERAFRDALRTRPVVAFADAVPALTALRSLRVPCAAVSASRHARALLASAGTDRLLATVVDGADAARLGLAGKPDPALFLHAAQVLGVRPRDCAVVEDALAGVLAGHRGGFGLVVGVDRTPDRHATGAMRERGAHLVVTDLMECVEAVWGAVQ